MLARSDSPLLSGDGTRGTAKSPVSSARAESRGKSRKVWRDRSANFISSHAAKYAKSTRDPSHDIPRWASAASPTHVYPYKTRREGNEIPIRQLACFVRSRQHSRHFVIIRAQIPRRETIPLYLPPSSRDSAEIGSSFQWNPGKFCRANLRSPSLLRAISAPTKCAASFSMRD